MDRYLQQFRVAAELKSISKAAKHLHLTQPTVSANLQRLESELGVRLYQRQSRGIALTSYGEAVLKHCQEVQQSRHRLHAELQDLQQHQLGKIRLGCGDAWWELFVRDALGAFLADHPVALTLSLGNHLDHLSQMLRGQIDCFIGHQIPGLARRSGVDFVPLFASVDVHFAGAGHPLFARSGAENEAVTGTELERYPLLAVTPDNDLQLDLLDDPQPKQQLSRQRHGSARPLYEVGTLAASIDMLKISQAVMPYPRAMADYLAGHQVLPLGGEDSLPGIIGLYQQRDEQNETTCRLIEQIVTAAGELTGSHPDILPL